MIIDEGVTDSVINMIIRNYSLPFVCWFLMGGMSSTEQKRTVSLEDRYVASMVLSGVGDALGYRNGNWEFCHSGDLIHKELKELGGLDNIRVDPKHWMVSDDTVMHIATAQALVNEKCQEDHEKLFACLATKYKESMRDMAGRAPGNTCMSSCHLLKPGRPQGHMIPFNPRGGGCGAAMRAMCIGLRYPEPPALNTLIRVSVESGRMTHHHPTGYLGALAAALFVSYSVQGKPLNEWGAGLMDTLIKAKEYIKQSGHEAKANLQAWDYFTKAWDSYLRSRGLVNSSEMPYTDPVFPEKYDVSARDSYYKSLSFSGWAGSSGHDAPMIAYDALLSSSLDWKELCSRSMFHSGDSDSTGVIAGACYGAMKGFEGVSTKNYIKLEYGTKLELLGRQLYRLAYPIVNSNADKGFEGIVNDLPSPPDETPSDLGNN